ncbi:hypothetical protein LCGC14_2467060 [marine sediment metagenome]|uniref:Carrier domain-containing protein n=1 Tax=marine sediment metagenome TaxID=412755 RepID=A0A0F9E5I7_9ZZZZ
MNDVDSRLKNCFLAVFPDLSADGVADATITSVEDWDSVSLVTLLSLVEEEFDVPILGDDVETLTSFMLISENLNARLRGATPS